MAIWTYCEEKERLHVLDNPPTIGYWLRFEWKSVLVSMKSGWAAVILPDWFNWRWPRHYHYFYPFTAWSLEGWSVENELTRILFCKLWILVAHNFTIYLDGNDSNESRQRYHSSGSLISFSVSIGPWKTRESTQHSLPLYETSSCTLPGGGIWIIWVITGYPIKRWRWFDVKQRVLPTLILKAQCSRAMYMCFHPCWIVWEQESPSQPHRLPTVLPPFLEPRPQPLRDVQRSQTRETNTNQIDSRASVQLLDNLY